MRKHIVGVMGGADVDEETLSDARVLGKLVAERGFVLLNGGRDAGVMAASAQGAAEAGGIIVGILPGTNDAGAGKDLTLSIKTGMGDARNVINVLSSDVVVALKGGMGTLSEVSLALKNGRSVITLGWEAGDDFQKYRDSGQLCFAPTPESAVDRVTELLQ